MGNGRKARPGVILVLSCALLAAFAVAPGFASQRWFPPAQTVSAAGQDASESDVAVDDAGNAVAVWGRSDGASIRIEAAVRPVGGSFGAPVAISAAGQDAFEPQVAVGPAGDAVALWSRSDGTIVRIQAAYRPAGGSFGAPQTISASGGEAFGPRVAMSAAGEAVAVWSRFDGTSYRAEAAIRPPGSGSSFGSAQSLSASGKHAFEEQVDVGPDGSAVAVWTRSENGGKVRVQAATRAAGGPFGSPQTISPSNEDEFSPDVSAGNGGAATAVWYGSDGVGKLRIESASQPAGGSFGGVQTLSDTGQDAYEPQVDLDPSGNAVAVWSRFDGANPRVQAASKPAGGSFGGPQTLSDAGTDASEPQIDLDPNGDALAAWYRPNGTSARVEVAARPLGGSFGAPRLLSEDGQDAFRPRIDASALNAVAVWYRSDGVKSRVQAVAREETHDSPRAAKSLYAALVPSYRQTISATQCTASGRNVSSHGPPLGFTSCDPPAFIPATQAFFGPRARGNVRFVALPSDVAVGGSLTDVRNAAGADYEPNGAGADVTIVSKLRIDDLGSSTATRACSPRCSATVQDFDFSIPVTCVANSDPSRGSTCNAVTSFNSVNVGAIVADGQSGLQVFRVRLNDSGANGLRGDGDDRNFGMQGVYIP